MTAPVLTVTASAGHMEVHAPLVHRCPFRDEVDAGGVAIRWEVDTRTFELHSLRAYLDTWRDVVISHEDLTETLRVQLSGHPGLTLLSITTAWDTAGMEVQCSTLPTLAGLP
jgi:NADPH-dependent 7-cyano-7-deazaguanine reductase QueF